MWGADVHFTETKRLADPHRSPQQVREQTLELIASLERQLEKLKQIPGNFHEIGACRKAIDDLIEHLDDPIR
jgi:hypothetical protein